MKLTVAFAATAFLAASTLAGGITMQYKLKPGQVWHCTQANQSESEFMGQKHRNRSKSVIEYTIEKGHKRGWVAVTGKIVSQSAPEGGGGMDLSKLTFTADVHSSGEARRIKTSGSAMPPMQGEIPPEMRAMYEQSSKMVADAWKHAVFWFPELPEYELQEGDEFEVERDMGMGGSGSGMQTQTLSRQVFTLEEVSKGLAYFSVKERSVTKTKGAMGGSSDTKIAGKGEAIFDLKQGMWLELTEKSRAKVSFAGMAGMGSGSQNMKIVHQYEMELQ
jgi:hypothetical protein